MQQQPSSSYTYPPVQTPFTPNQSNNQQSTTYNHTHLPPPFIPIENNNYPPTMVYPPPPPPAVSAHPTGWTSNPPTNPVPSRKSSASSGVKRRPSDAEEEAGLALAGLGLGLSAGEMKARRDSQAKNKRAKGSEGKKNEKKSCAECRRLKAKCDRVFPCSNCRRRGCALVCPDGDLSCMQGKRLVLASTEQLHERIAQLEAALAKSSNTHPLLAPEYLDGGATSPPTLTHSHSRDRSSDTASLTTPRLSAERGGSQGRMAVEALLTDDIAAPEGKNKYDWVGSNAAPALMLGAVGDFGDELESRTVVEHLQKLLRVLPPLEVTRSRAKAFFATSAWYQTLLSPDEFNKVYESAVYDPTSANPLTPHKLAVVLMVLTLSTYFDLTEEEDNPAVGRYWEACQRCFDTQFGWAASVAGVQALGLAALFVAFGFRGAKASNFYWLRQMTLAIQQLGLHKEPHPSLPEHEKEFRRRVFHEAYTIDCLMSINHCQRTGILLENIEAKEPASVSPLQRVKYEYMRNVKAQVIDIGCRPDTSPASWEAVQRIGAVVAQYDARCQAAIHCPLLRGEPLPPIPNRDSITADIPVLINTTTSMCHYKAKLFLYRPSLRRLIARVRRGETHPLSVEEREVVSNTYEACHSIIACSRYLIRTHPRLSARFWAVWVQALSAAVSIAAMAIWCGPLLEPGFIESCYNELTGTCEAVKEHGSMRSRGVLSLFPVLQSLVHNRYPRVVGKASTGHVSTKGEEMLFTLLGGQIEAEPIPAPPPQTQPQSQPQTIHNSPVDGKARYPPPYVNDVVLPIVNPQPSAVAFETYPTFDMYQAPYQNYENPSELWTQLQTFYEPTPAYWGENVA